MRRTNFNITNDVFVVGSAELSCLKDCCIYLINFGELILIDCGCGEKSYKIVENIKSVKLDPNNLKMVLLTHCHIDHAGGAKFFKEKYSAKIAIHQNDVEPLKVGDNLRTGATLYNMNFEPVEIDFILEEEEGILRFKQGDIKYIHTPGHTPGSICPYVDVDGIRILFGQDIHGPFSISFGSNVDDWKISMEKLISLDADILCEGHYGVYEGKKRVRKYIEHFIRKNEKLSPIFY